MSNDHRPGNIQEEIAPVQIGNPHRVEYQSRVTKAEPEPTHENAFISTVWNES